MSAESRADKRGCTRESYADALCSGMKTAPPRVNATGPNRFTSTERTGRRGL